MQYFYTGDSPKITNHKLFSNTENGIEDFNSNSMWKNSDSAECIESVICVKHECEGSASGYM